MMWTISNMLSVRLIALVIPTTLAFFFFPKTFQDTLLVLLLFATLPVSSLVTSLLPTNTHDSFNAKLSCAVTASTLYFIALLTLAVIIIK